MRSLCLLPWLFLATPSIAQDWTPIDLGTTEDILYVEATSFNWTWVAGAGGLVVQSNSTRTVWTTIDVGTTADQLSVIEPSGGQVWTGAGNGVVRRLIGGSWEGRNLPNSSEDFTLFTRSSGTSWAVGTGGSIYRSTNGGDSWALKHSAGVPLHAGSGFINGPAYVVGGQGLVLYTNDAGTTWTPFATGTTEDLWAFKNAGSAGLFACGTNGTIIRSLDGGTTWDTMPSGTTQDLYDIGTSGATAFWLLASGANGTVLRSTDGGDTWCRLSAGTQADLYGATMVNNNEYIVGGEGGLLLRTVTGGGDCNPVSVAEAAPVRTWHLNVAPNPLHGIGRVAFGGPLAGEITLELYDVNGRRVRNLLDSRRAGAGERSVRLDATGLPAGVYFLRLDTGTRATGQRITVIR